MAPRSGESRVARALIVGSSLERSMMSNQLGLELRMPGDSGRNNTHAQFLSLRVCYYRLQHKLRLNCCHYTRENAICDIILEKSIDSLIWHDTMIGGREGKKRVKRTDISRNSKKSGGEWTVGVLHRTLPLGRNA